MMESTTVHLLTLPREIRNEIYKYLHRKIYLRSYRYTEVNDTSDWFRRADATIQNAPLINVLLTHSQIHDEYREAPCFRRPSAVFNIYIDQWFSRSLATFYMSPSNQRHLARVRHATFLIRGEIGVVPNLNILAMQVASTFLLHTPSLQFVRFAVWSDETLIRHDRMACVRNTSLSSTLPPPVKSKPAILAGLPLARNGHGYHSAYELGRWKEEPGETTVLQRVRHVWVFSYTSDVTRKKSQIHGDVATLRDGLYHSRREEDVGRRGIRDELARRSSRLEEWEEGT